MTTHIRIPQALSDRIHCDLSRSHMFAWERVGFVTCSVSTASSGVRILLAETWYPVDDEDYIDDPTVGAMVGPAGFRKILQVIYNNPRSLFHVHRHDHRGLPRFSSVDVTSMRAFVPGFFNTCPTLPHGALVLSLDCCAGTIWLRPYAQPVEIEKIEVLRL